MGACLLTEELCERLHHPIHRRVLPVLDLDPVLGPTGLIGSIPALRRQAFKAHIAGRAEEIRADLAALKRIDKDSVWPAAEPVAPDWPCASKAETGGDLLRPFICAKGHPKIRH